MQACNTLRKRHGFGYPPPFRDSKPHFPASLHRFRRHGRLCPKGNKSAAWDAPRFPNLPWRHWLCSTGSEGLLPAFRGRLKLRSNNCFHYPPTFRDSKPHFPQACIGLTGMGGFAPKEAKALLGVSQGSQICPAALVAQHRFRRSKKALPTAFRGRLRSGNCFGYPSTFRDSKPHFPASLHRFRRRGWLCPEGNKSAAWEVRQIAPALQHRSCAASLINFKKDSSCPVLAIERAIPILHRRRPRRIAVCVHRKSGWNPERKRPLPFRATAQRNGLFSMFLFVCSAFFFDAVSGHSPSGKSEGTVSPGTKAHAAQVKGSHANPCKPAWAEKP